MPIPVGERLPAGNKPLPLSELLTIIGTAPSEGAKADTRQQLHEIHKAKVANWEHTVEAKQRASEGARVERQRKEEERRERDDAVERAKQDEIRSQFLVNASNKKQGDNVQFRAVRSEILQRSTNQENEDLRVGNERHKKEEDELFMRLKNDVANATLQFEKEREAAKIKAKQDSEALAKMQLMQMEENQQRKEMERKASRERQRMNSERTNERTNKRTNK
eukprot:GHVU01085764.1.p1 GENE.GHVU01085764.1~~GHVU01085764.1.p1  ORF type:complete len:221 (-),score=43.77 GHVU01085764.1:894-1556(-)